MITFTFVDGSSYSEDVSDLVALAEPLEERLIHFSQPIGYPPSYLYAIISPKLTEAGGILNTTAAGRKKLYESSLLTANTIASKVLGVGKVTISNGLLPFTRGTYIPISPDWYKPGTDPYSFSLFFDLDQYTGKIHYDPKEVSKDFIRQINQKGIC
jgi:hypothetical protein